MRRRLAGLTGAVTLAAGLALGACATADPRHDARIESEVKARLVAEKDVDLTRLGVVSRKSVVYLTGAVESPTERERAQQVAAGVPGVQRVINAVDVRGSGAR
jgi:hyperosmotically inducible periplasmic protein